MLLINRSTTAEQEISMTIQTTARNANLSDLATMLTEQRAAAIDLVVPSSQMRSSGGNIVVRLPEPDVSESGVTDVATFRPTAVFDEGISSKLGIPLAYVRTLRAERPDLYDANVNGWLHGRTVVRGDEREIIAAADSRSFMLRGFRGDDPDNWIARALLSDSYKRIDHLDALTAALAGVTAAGVEANVHSADLTDRRMVVRISAPEVAAVAPRLLAGYRSPFSGANGSDNPTVFAGFEISNSETGGGAFTITPRIVVQICTNGMKITRDAMRAIHVGGKMDEGVIEWSDATQQKQLDLITSKTTDAVRTFLNVEYLERTIVALEERAEEPVSDAVKDVTSLSKGLGFTESQIAGVLDQFVRGGQMTRGGVVNAITAYAQTVEDGDDAYELERKATALLV